MSRQPPIRPEQGSYGQFQLPTSQPKTPFSRSKGALAKLRESIPQDEGQWQRARDLHRYNTADDVLQKTRHILENRNIKQDLIGFLIIASCCVDWHLGRKQEAYQKYKTQIGDTSELTIQRYMSAVRAMVQAMERVNLRGQRHRVFEGALLYSRISPSFLTHYTKVTGDFDSCFPTFRCIHPEIQASLPLAPVFILKYRHPQYRFGDICAALGTEVLGEDDYARFVSVLENGRPVPAVLSLPANAPFTALSVIKCQPESARDGQKVAANTTDDVNLFALPASFPLVYKVFGISDATQQLLLEIAHQSNYESLQEVPNTPLLELRWIDDYDILVDQLVGDLIEQSILPQQSFQRYKSFYRHEPGSVSVPPGWIKIIVPFVLVHQDCQVSIASKTVAKQDITWNEKMGLILGSDMLFSTSHQILYYSISIPLGPPNR